MKPTFYELRRNAIQHVINNPAARAKYPHVTEAARQAVYGACSDTHKDMQGVRARWLYNAPLDELLDTLKRWQDGNMKTITFSELLALPHDKRPTVKAVGGLCDGETVTSLRADWWFCTGPHGMSRSWCVTPDEKFEVVMTMTPTDHEKREWRRLATDAYAKDLNDTGHKFSAAGALRNGESMPLATFDALQSQYHAWLIDGFQLLQLCGHPVSDVESGNEGTNHCAACEREARQREQSIIGTLSNEGSVVSDADGGL